MAPVKHIARYIAALATLVPIWAGAYGVGGMEDRCTELDANCVCSEPFNTTTLVQSGINCVNPADTTSAGKQCTAPREFDGTNSPACGASFTLWTTGSSSTIINLLPNPDPAFQHYIRGIDDHTAVQWIGGTAAGFPVARRCMRYYFYRSAVANGDPSNYTLGGNEKMMSTAHNDMYNWNVASTTGYNLYAMDQVGWTSNTHGAFGSCCNRGPTPGPNPTMGTYRGVWHRIEQCVSNADGSGSGYSMKIYDKEIGTAEKVQVDFGVNPCSVSDTCNASGGFSYCDWCSPTVDSPLTPPSTHDIFEAGFYRESAVGYKAASHFMVAAWATDTGQRICGAKEVEGNQWDQGIFSDGAACVGAGPPPDLPEISLQRISVSRKAGWGTATFLVIALLSFIWWWRQWAHPRR